MTGTVEYAVNAGTKIAYQRCTEPVGDPLLLVTGLGSQMVFWPQGFADKLHEAGFQVVEFDNRDTGLSDRFASTKAVNPWLALLGRAEPPPYTGDDMADDGFAVMDALGWDSAHLVGVSMGSALVQYMAVRRPERVRSIACISTLVSGNPVKLLSQLKPGSFLKLSRLRFPDTPEGKIDQQVAVMKAMAPAALPFDEAWAREVAAIAVERGVDDTAQSRHLAALKATRDKLDYTKITAPTLILQGSDDPLIRISAAQAVAHRIAQARFQPFDNMGHGVYPGRWDDIVDAIRDNANRA